MMVESHPVKMHLLGSCESGGQGILRPYDDMSSRGERSGGDQVCTYLLTVTAPIVRGGGGGSLTASLPQQGSIVGRKFSD